MTRLDIKQVPYGGVALCTMRVGGFNDGELNELKSMEHREARDKLIEMLNDRNDGEGNVWACGYGIYGIWFDNEYAYVNIGNTCD